MTTQLKYEEVERVYTGVAGKCCCGCSGKYSYNPMLPVPEGAEASLRSVKLIVNKINRATKGVDDGGNYVALESGNGRLLVAYRVKAVVA